MINSVVQARVSRCDVSEEFFSNKWNTFKFKYKQPGSTIIGRTEQQQYVSDEFWMHFSFPG